MHEMEYTKECRAGFVMIGVYRIAGWLIFPNVEKRMTLPRSVFKKRI